MNRLIVSAVLTLSILGIATSGYSGEILVSQRAQDSAGKYVIEFPTDWKITNGKDLGVDLVAEASSVGKGKQFLENANVISQKLDAPTTIRDFFDSGLPEIKKFEGFRLGKVEATTINNLDALSIEYSYISNGAEVMVLQYVVIKGNLAVVVTFGADPTDYSTAKPLFDDIADTLVIN